MMSVLVEVYLLTIKYRYFKQGDAYQVYVNEATHRTGFYDFFCDQNSVNKQVYLRVKRYWLIRLKNKLCVQYLVKSLIAPDYVVNTDPSSRSQ